MKPQKKILVTGGSGFIGTHLTRALLGKNHEVRILDLKDSALSHANLEKIKGDVTNPETVENSIRGCDAVVHLAALASVVVCEKNPVESHKTNVGGTLQVLQAIQKTEKEKPLLLFAASASCYGAVGKKDSPISESTPLPEPLSLYAAQKIEAEHLIRQYSKEFSIPASVFRLFNVYGEGQDPLSPYSGVISVFLHRIRNSLALELHGGGNQTRDYISIEDIVKGFLLALDSPREKMKGEPINLGSGKATSVREIAMILMQAAQKEVPLKDGPARSGDVPHSCAEITRAKDVLGWGPEVSLVKGLSGLIHGNH